MTKRILVIDDDAAVRKSFQLALEDKPYQVDTAETGEKGLQFFENGTYHLVYLDLKMPGMNGVETLYRLREKDRTVPVYIITAFHAEFMEGLTSARKEGVEFELVRKPIGAEEIVTVTESVLKGPLAQE